LLFSDPQGENVQARHFDLGTDLKVVERFANGGVAHQCEERDLVGVAILSGGFVELARLTRFEASEQHAAIVVKHAMSIPQRGEHRVYCRIDRIHTSKFNLSPFHA
jgi:hypothetical protein